MDAILLYLTPYLVSLSISIGVGLYAYRHRTVSGAGAYAWVALSQAMWTLGYVLELISTGLEAKIFWDDVQFVAGAGWTLAFLTFSFRYTGRRFSQFKRIMGLLAIVQAVFLLLVFTDGLHGWIRPEAWLVPGELFSELAYDFSALVWMWAFYGYGLVLAGISLLIGRYIRPHRFYRIQVGIIVVGALIPLVGTLLTLLGVTFTFHRDTTPFTSAIGNLIVAWGLFRYRLFNVVPVARDAVIESMNDLVLVLDAQNRVVDFNPAAQAAIAPETSSIIGWSASQAFSNWPDLFEQYRDMDEEYTEIVVGDGESQRHFDLSLSSLHDRRVSRVAGCAGRTCRGKTGASRRRNHSGGGLGARGNLRRSPESSPGPGGGARAGIGKRRIHGVVPE